MIHLDRKRIIKQNLLAHRLEVRRIRLAMITASVLLILFLGTLMGLKRAFAEINDVFLKDRQIWVGCSTEDDVRNIVSELSTHEGVEGLRIGGFAYLKPSDCELSITDLLALETGDCVLKYEDSIFQGQSVQYKSGSAFPVWIQFIADHIVDQTKPNLDILQNGTTWFTPPEMLSKGRLPSGEHEMLLSGYILRAFGIEDAKQPALVGKPLSLGLKYNDDVHICIENYILTGIISDQYISHQPAIFSHIWISYDRSNTELKYQSELGMDTGYLFSIQAHTDSFKRCRSLCKEFEASGHEDVGYPLTVQTAIFLNDTITISERLFSFVLIAFCLILLISVVSGLYFYCESVNESYHMLYTLGCTKHDLKCITHSELLRILGRAYAWSLLLTVGILLFLPKLLNRLTHGITIFTLSYSDIGLSLLSGGLLCVLCYFITALSIKGILSHEKLE